MIEFFKEFLQFIKVRKKYWLIPILLILVLFGSIIVLSHGSVLTPFLYTFF